MNEIEAQFIIQLSKLSHKLVKKVDSQLAIHGISFTEYMILHYLDGAPTNTMRRIDLAEAVGLSASGVTRLLAPMQKIKLVQKEANPRDARVSLVKLSEPGKSVYDDATTSFQHISKSLVHNLTSEQAKKMLGFMSQL